MNKHSKSPLLIGAAIAGIVGAAAILSTAPAQAAKPEMGLCKGANSCSGKSVWGSNKGKNGCAGEGYATLSKADCEKKNLTWQPMPKKEKKGT